MLPVERAKSRTQFLFVVHNAVTFMIKLIKINFECMVFTTKEQDCIMATYKGPFCHTFVLLSPSTKLCKLILRPMISTIYVKKISINILSDQLTFRVLKDEYCDSVFVLMSLLTFPIANELLVYQRNFMFFGILLLRQLSYTNILHVFHVIKSLTSCKKFTQISSRARSTGSCINWSLFSYEKMSSLPLISLVQRFFLI